MKLLKHLALSLFALVNQASAQLFSEDFDADHTANWIVNSNYGPGTNAASFFFDYSTVGIPSAPHSIGGTTRGLKLGANLLGVATPSLAGISVSPTGKSFTGNYVLRFDWWHNWLGAASGGIGNSAGGSGSTQLSTYGIRTSGTSPNLAGVCDSVFFAATGNGAAAQDFRTYSPEKTSGYVVGDAHNTYAAGDQNESAALYQTLFPAGATAPAAQVTASSLQSGSTLAGRTGFRWHDVEIAQSNSIVTWKVDGTLIAILDTTSLVTPTAGNNILFGMSDTSTGAGTPAGLFQQLDFTLIDNITVTGITRLVTTTNDSGAGSLRQAIAVSTSDDTIVFATNLSGATIKLTSGELVLDKNLTIDASALTNGITLNGNHAGRIFEMADSMIVVLTALTITNGYNAGLGGGGVLNRGSLTVNQCTLSGNQADGLGGGVFNLSGTTTVNQSTFSDNRALSGADGGGICNQATLKVNQSTLSGNHADGHSGGGIYNNGTLILSNSIVAANIGSDGADIKNYGTLTRVGANIIQSIANDGTISGPAAISAAPVLAPLGNYGGPTKTMPPLAGSPAIDACTSGSGFATDQRGLPRIAGPLADIGAAEFQNASPAVINNENAGIGSLRYAIDYCPAGSTITFDEFLSGETILITSGELVLKKNLTIDASALADGITINGHAASRIFTVASGTTSVLTGLTITNGNVFNYGGGILNSGTLTVNQCTLSSNAAGIAHARLAGGGGGGIANFGALTVNQSTLSGNHADSRFGGGIYNGGTLTVNQCTLSGNHTDGESMGGGGGAYNSGTLIVNQSTVSGNSVAYSDEGGAILNDFNGTLAVNQSTLSGNAPGNSGYYGGIVNYGTFTLSNSVVAGNFERPGHPGADINNIGTFTRVGANLIQSFVNSGASSGPAAINAAPLLASLGNHGGLTQTMPPLPGSPAIDGCTNGSGFATDQRGLPRPTGLAPDIGAVEVQSLIIYDDALENSWLDYSYNCTRNFANTSPVHSGPKSVSVAITSPYGGAQFHHDSFTNTAFSGISFWINGGAAGGQHLQLYGVLGGVTQAPRFYLAPLPTNSWVHYVVPLSALGVANTTNFDAFVFQDSTGSAQATFYLDDLQLDYSVPVQLPPPTVIYDDALENSWSDYSYNCTRNFANTALVHSGVNAISVAITSPYGGAQFHHDSFANSAFGGISFWVNGGATGGQHLQIYGVLGGVTQTPRYYLAPLPTNSWVYYAVPLSALGVANTTNFDAFVFQDSAGTGQPTFYLDDLQLEYAIVAQPSPLGSAQVLGNGTFTFAFTGLSGASFTVFGSTDLALPMSEWSNLGPAVETPPGSGQYQFTDPQASSNSSRYYRVRSP